MLGGRRPFNGSPITNHVYIHSFAELRTVPYRTVPYGQVQHVLDERAMLARVAGHPFIINLLATFQVGSDRRTDGLAAEPEEAVLRVCRDLRRSPAPSPATMQGKHRTRTSLRYAAAGCPPPSTSPAPIRYGKVVVC